MTKIWFRLSLLIGFAILLTLRPAPKLVFAQWPPFSFELTSAYKNGQITYNIEFEKEVNWPMADVTIKIPLPEGTRFLEANAQPTTRASFDGAEITFFTSVLHQPIKNASFIVEVQDPTKTTFIARAWVAWKGHQPGDFLTDETSIDITRQPLDWTPPNSRLRLEASAFVTDEVITYEIYPLHVGKRRMWDLKINVPVPEGTRFLSAEAPPPFVTSFDGREVSFFIVELERQAEVGPLRFKVSLDGVTTPFVVTHAWATWKNADKRVGQTMVFREELRGGDIIVQPHTSQQVVSDMIGDTPFSNYDLTSIAIEEDGTALKITFYPVGDLGPADEPVEYGFYIDSDCQRDTGRQSGSRGAEYRVRYRHQKNETKLYFWDEEESEWINSVELEFKAHTGEKMVTMWVPYDLLENIQQFCWLGRARNRTSAFHPDPSSEWIGLDPRMTRYETRAGSPESFTGELFSNSLTNENQALSITPPE